MERILVLLILLSTTNRNSSSNLVSINEYINNIVIDADYTKEKVQLVRKIIPYMPLDYIEAINRSIHITESLVKIMELDDYMNRSTSSIQAAPIVIEDKRERLSKIVSVIQKEVAKSNIHNKGNFLEMIINIDKYKKMFDLLNSFMQNQNSAKDPEKLAKMVEPMIKGNAQGEEALDIEKIMNIMNILNQSKKKDSKTEGKSSTRDSKEEISSPKKDSPSNIEDKNKPNEN